MNLVENDELFQDKAWRRSDYCHKREAELT